MARCSFSSARRFWMYLRWTQARTMATSTADPSRPLSWRCLPLPSAYEVLLWPMPTPRLCQTIVCLVYRPERCDVQCEGQFGKKMVFRPATLNSRHHKRLTQAVERHHVKVQRVQKTTTTEDPAKAKVYRSSYGLNYAAFVSIFRCEKQHIRALQSCLCKAMQTSGFGRWQSRWARVQAEREKREEERIRATHQLEKKQVMFHLLLDRSSSL